MWTIPKTSMAFKVLCVSLLFGAAWLFADEISISSPGATDTVKVAPTDFYMANGTSDTKGATIKVMFKKAIFNDPDVTFEDFWDTETGVTPMLGSWSGMWHHPQVNWIPDQVYLFKVQNFNGTEFAAASRSFIGKKAGP